MYHLGGVLFSEILGGSQRLGFQRCDFYFLVHGDFGEWDFFLPNIFFWFAQHLEVYSFVFFLVFFWDVYRTISFLDDCRVKKTK